MVDYVKVNKISVGNRFMYAGNYYTVIDPNSAYFDYDLLYRVDSSYVVAISTDFRVRAFRHDELVLQIGEVDE